MIHWAEFYFEVGNFCCFQYLNLDVGKESYPPLFEFYDEDANVTIPPSSPGYTLPRHANYDWLHANQFAQSEWSDKFFFVFILIEKKNIKINVE